MNNSTNGQDRAEKRLKVMGGSLVMVFVLAGCAYFFPTHPIVVVAVSCGSFLAILNERQAAKASDLASSILPSALSDLCSAALKVLQWPLRVTGLLPKNDD